MKNGSESKALESKAASPKALPKAKVKLNSSKSSKVLKTKKTGETAETPVKERIHLLDELRGFAIVCMVVHHTFYDIGFMLGMDFGYRVFDALCLVQPIFWALFIGISGICSRLSKSPIRRGIIVFAGGLLVTFVTAVIMPAMGFTGAEIYCGILSCLGLCMIITGFCMPLFKRIDWRVGAAVSLALFFLTYTVSSHSLLFGAIPLPMSWYRFDALAMFGFYSSSFHSADYFALLPWLFFFFFGAFIGKFAKEEKLPKFFYKSHIPPLSAAGRNSLWVYLLHQPILSGVMALISLAMGG